MISRFRSVALVGGLLFTLLPMSGVRGQEPDTDTPRGIFDTQTQQKSPSNTVTRKRTNVPVRPKVAGQVSEKTETVSAKMPKDRLTALKFSVMAGGTPTPSGYEVSRNLTKVQQSVGGRDFGIADPQRNFREGDIIYLLFEVSQPGYLYIVNLGSDGTTRTLIHPDQGMTAQVTPDDPLKVGPLRIDPPAGVDRLTVLFSKTRIESFENPNQDLTAAFFKELSSRNYRTLEEEEVHLPSKQVMALYFSNQGDLLKAEIDIKHPGDKESGLK